MHVPGLLERVRLSGLGEVYLVTRVDREARAADLMPVIYGHDTVESVPFVVMEPIPGCGPPKLRTKPAVRQPRDSVSRTSYFSSPGAS